MAEAIFISENIFKFTELMEQPVFMSLQNTEHYCVYDLMSAYKNQRNYNYFNMVINTYK